MRFLLKFWCRMMRSIVNYNDIIRKQISKMTIIWSNNIFKLNLLKIAGRAFLYTNVYELQWKASDFLELPLIDHKIRLTTNKKHYKAETLQFCTML